MRSCRPSSRAAAAIAMSKRATYAPSSIRSRRSDSFVCCSFRLLPDLAGFCVEMDELPRSHTFSGIQKFRTL
ncbi:hypothetical protein Zm00014a_034274 [Zea mays]|uniref:Uncharacterized protein n=1 Tax=Zea mays TaxID=4577 RepID=A0A317YD63_MAIZE|nr:hypothetical protein Zm00014a_034274 [Zea mays]